MKRSQNSSQYGGSMNQESVCSGPQTKIHMTMGFTGENTGTTLFQWHKNFLHSNETLKSKALELVLEDLSTVWYISPKSRLLKYLKWRKKYCTQGPLRTIGSGAMKEEKYKPNTKTM